MSRKMAVHQCVWLDIFLDEGYGMIIIKSAQKDGGSNFYCNDVPFVSFKLFAFYMYLCVRDAAIIYNIRNTSLMELDILAASFVKSDTVKWCACKIFLIKLQLHNVIIKM